MSFQRAYIACMRCYNLADEHLDKGYSPDSKEIKIALARDDQLHISRRQALEALETVIDRIDRLPSEIRNPKDPETKDVIGFKRAQADQSLDACKGCNYTTPSIVDFLDREDVD